VYPYMWRLILCFYLKPVCFIDVILYGYFTLLFIRISIDLTCIAAYYLAFQRMGIWSSHATLLTCWRPGLDNHWRTVPLRWYPTGRVESV